jgi:hypothetical protein
VARQLGPLLAQPVFEIGNKRHAQCLPDLAPAFGALAVDLALDVE